MLADDRQSILLSAPFFGYSCSLSKNISQTRERRFSMLNYSRGKLCCDCGKPVSNLATRCKSCAATLRQQGMPKSATTVCKTCGKTFAFAPSRENPQCCSRQCQRDYGKIPCPVCGILFKPKNLTQSKTKTCSLKCRDMLRQNRIKVTCHHCGKDFERCVSQAVSAVIFCSVKCKQSFWKGKNHSSYNSVDCVCGVCGKHFVRNSSKLKHNGTFCSRRCFSLSQVIPGTSEYRGPNWNEQKRNARKRDNYTCQGCGVHQNQYGKCLDVHHIVPFRNFGVDNYLQANHLDNLVSLCKTCHMLTERGNRTLAEIKLLR